MKPTVEDPQAVDAHDGFEDQECRTKEEIEAALARTVESMNLKLNQERGTAKANQLPSDTNMRPGMPCFEQGGASTGAQVSVIPDAVKLLQYLPMQSGGSRGNGSEPQLSDMIPALRDLSQIGLSLTSDFDVWMPASDTVLGKRMAEEQEMQGQKLNLSLALTYSAPTGGKTKRGRKGASSGAQGDQKDMVADGVAARTRNKIATSHLQPANLTRPNVWSRQEQ
jgi:hypothetical protein